MYFFPLLLAVFICLFLHYRKPKAVREPAYEERCASNLRQVGLAISHYAQRNQGSFPDTLEALVVAGDLDPRCWICELTSDTPAEGSTPQALAAELRKPGHKSYLYFGKGLTTLSVTDDMVIAGEPPLNHNGNGGVVLLGNGAQDWEAGAWLTAKQKQNLARTPCNWVGSLKRLLGARDHPWPSFGDNGSRVHITMPGQYR